RGTAIRAPSHIVVMEYDELSFARHLDVELHHVGTESPRHVNGRYGVLRRERSRTTMRDVQKRLMLGHGLRGWNRRFRSRCAGRWRTSGKTAMSSNTKPVRLPRDRICAGREYTQ